MRQRFFNPDRALGSPGSEFRIAMAVLIACCESLAAEPATTAARIGLLVPADNAEAEILVRGATLGIKAANERPGVKVELAVRGKPGQWGTEGDEAAVLALDEEVAGIISPPDGAAAHQVLQIAGRTRIPVISLCSDTSVTGAGVPWARRIVPSQTEEALAIFEGIKRLAGANAPRRCLAVLPPERSGREAARDLTTAAATVHLPTPDSVAVRSEGDQWKSLVDQALANSPDGVLLWLPPAAAARVARYARDRGFKGWLAGPNRLASPRFFESAGSAAENLVIAAIDEQGCAVGLRQRFDRDYRTQFHADPDALSRMAHDAVLVLAHWIRDPHRERTLRTWPGGGDQDGVTGPLRFDPTGGRILPLVAQIWREGAFQQLPLSVTPSQATMPNFP